MDNKTNEISGWYYDLQMKNRLLCVSLHPNQKFDGQEWIDAYDGDEDPDNPMYRSTPLCTAIVNEDFSVSVANSWSDFGGDMIGQLWESVKPLAPYADWAANAIHNAVTDKDYLAAKNSGRFNGSRLSTLFANAMETLDYKIQHNEVDVTDYLNRALVMQGTRFSYYSGSGTSFSNLVMKFTVFPTYDGAGNFITVNSKIDELLPYCIGQFVTEKITKSGDGANSQDTKNTGLDFMIGWQKPPGGFKANIKNVDAVQTGTLLLKFGPYYAIDNLVVENANFNYSRQMVKNPKGDSKRATEEADSEIVSPLYCDVTIQLRPATKYSDVSLRKFVFGRSTQTALVDLNEELKDALR